LCKYETDRTNFKIHNSQFTISPNTQKAMPWPDGQTSQTINLAGPASGTYIARITHNGQALCQCNIRVAY
jgi:hypothetical protein